MAYDKYKKLKLQYTYGTGDAWKDVMPPRYKAGELIEENSPDCGGVSSIYRWYALPDEFICDGYNKYYKEVYQVSTDGGLTWENVTPLQTRKGQLKEANSIVCGYGITWELVPDEYICEKTTGEHYNRYQKLQKYYLGQPFEPASYKKGQLIETGEWDTIEECENPIVISNLNCDVAVYDNVNNVINIVKGSDYNNQLYSEDRYKIIGIVVVPFEHDVYGDGSAGIMSLKLMSADNPDNGYWGLRSRPCFGQENVVLNNFNTFPYVGYYQDEVGSAGDENSTIIGNCRDGYLPSGNFVDAEGIVCPHNTNVYYNGSRVIENTDHEIYYLLPSPYLTNGNRNPSYYQTESPSSPNNALSDFDGLSNSKKLIELATAQSDWKTRNEIYSSIYNDPSDGHSPAACCCWRYHTDGTKQGDWYLPSAGEIGYFINNYDKIKNTLNILAPEFIEWFNYETNFLTSTSVITSKPSTVFPQECIAFDKYGCMYAIGRDAYCSAFAFIRIKPDGTIIN